MSSFHLGLGVFETLRVEHGNVSFIEEHWASLKLGAKALGLKVTTDFRKAAAKLPTKSGRWRWVIEPDSCYHLFSAQKLDAKKSFTLALAPQRLGSANWDARFKTLSYLTHLQARRSVEADEALLLNEYGHLASGAMSNLFWVRDGMVYTSTVDAGCRAGIIRGWLKKQIPVKEGFFFLDTLENADEIFMTNSLIGIMPVRRFGKRIYKSGKVSLQLKKLYNKRSS